MIIYLQGSNYNITIDTDDENLKYFEINNSNQPLTCTISTLDGSDNEVVEEEVAEKKEEEVKDEKEEEVVEEDKEEVAEENTFCNYRTFKNLSIDNTRETPKYSNRMLGAIRGSYNPVLIPITSRIIPKPSNHRYNYASIGCDKKSLLGETWEAIPPPQLTTTDLVNNKFKIDPDFRKILHPTASSIQNNLLTPVDNLFDNEEDEKEDEKEDYKENEDTLIPLHNELLQYVNKKKMSRCLEELRNTNEETNEIINEIVDEIVNDTDGVVEDDNTSAKVIDDAIKSYISNYIEIGYDGCDETGYDEVENEEKEEGIEEENRLEKEVEISRWLW